MRLYQPTKNDELLVLEDDEVFNVDDTYFDYTHKPNEVKGVSPGRLAAYKKAKSVIEKLKGVKRINHLVAFDPDFPGNRQSHGEQNKHHGTLRKKKRRTSMLSRRRNRV